MKNIAFKRAKTTPNVKDSLHPEYIVEFADTTLFPPDFHKPEDGYEILPEDQFQQELAKNHEKHEQFQVDTIERNKMKLKIRAHSEIKKRANHKLTEREDRRVQMKQQREQMIEERRQKQLDRLEQRRIFKPKKDE
jgi:hypothetical protein